MGMKLPISADADIIAFTVSSNAGGNTGTLSIVGLVTTEVVAVQIPKVENPVEGNDDHWTPMMQEDEAVVLNAGNNVIRVPAELSIRLVKSAGVAGNTYGVRWS